VTTLITGSSGFIGMNLCSKMTALGHDIHKVIRSGARLDSYDSIKEHCYLIDEIGAHTDWSGAFAGINCVVHCAARVRLIDENKTDALSAYRTVNVDGTRNLAEQAFNAGVKRFIFLSSIKVNGEQTISGGRFTSKDDNFPKDAYGISKWEAEHALHEISVRTGLEVVIIRPPLVYGSGVKGSFLSLLGWLNKGIPLPLGAIKNQRSLVGIHNLIDLIMTCIDHPAAANQTFLVSDGEDISTSELLCRMSKALGKTSRLVPVPVSLLQLGANLLGKQDIAQRLLGNLQVDISHTKKVLGWTPPVSLDEGLRTTAKWYLS